MKKGIKKVRDKNILLVISTRVLTDVKQFEIFSPFLLILVEFQMFHLFFCPPIKQMRERGWKKMIVSWKSYL